MAVILYNCAGTAFPLYVNSKYPQWNKSSFLWHTRLKEQSMTREADALSGRRPRACSQEERVMGFPVEKPAAQHLLFLSTP
jgi:hypothetical protein